MKATDATPSRIGEVAPTFTLPDQSGKMHDLSDYSGRRIVLFFYPKDDTEGCTREACGFRDLGAEFAKVGASVLGISILNAKSKAKFATKNGIGYPLLADEDHAVSEAFGVWIEKSMYGKKYMGISRETFVIGADGRIEAHWTKAPATEAHAEEVLAKLAELGGSRR